MKIKTIEYADIPGIVIITPEIYRDNRGYFYESFNFKEYQDIGLPIQFLQDNQAFSKKGILRGFHYQLRYPQGKLVRVIVGKVLDVAVDIRIGSPNFGHSTSVILSDSNHKIMYIPEGFAHAYMVLSDEALFQYKCTNVYHPEDDYGIAWNDSSINVDWPFKNPILSKKDRTLPRINQINEKLLPAY